MKNKLNLVYIKEKNMSCIPQPYYDLYEDNGKGTGYNIACILTDKEGAKLIRKWIKQHNEDIK